MHKREFMTLLNESLTLDNPVKSGDETLAELGSWDSMAMVEFQAIADEHFDTAVAPELLARCETVKDLAALLGDAVDWSESAAAMR